MTPRPTQGARLGSGVAHSEARCPLFADVGAQNGGTAHQGVHDDPAAVFEMLPGDAFGAGADVGDVAGYRSVAQIGRKREAMHARDPRRGARLALEKLQIGAEIRKQPEVVALAKEREDRIGAPLVQIPPGGIAHGERHVPDRSIRRGDGELAARLVLIEQNARKALQVAARGYVLETGSIVKQGAAAALLADDDVRKAYLGED